MRAEKIARESSIQEEIETYNNFLGSPGELACVLLIEIEAESDRKPLLESWMGLEKCIYMLDESGNKIFAEHDPAQVGDRRLSAVQYHIRRTVRRNQTLRGAKVSTCRRSCCNSYLLELLSLLSLCFSLLSLCS